MIFLKDYKGELMKNISQLLFCALIFSIITIYASDGSNLQFRVAQALIEAVSNDNVGLTEIVLNHKACPNAKIEHGITPLHIAASRGNVRTVSVLIKHGALLDLANDFGQTALHFAAMYGYPDVINILSQHHANINAPDAGYETPLHAAIRYKQPESVKALLTCKANPDLPNSKNETPAQLAQHSDNKDINLLLSEWPSLHSSAGKSSPKL
jgi:ankyrin repeat protein